MLINEFDYVEGGVAAQLFRDNYLERPQNGADPVEYPYYVVAPVNTGVPSGLDLDNSGTVGDVHFGVEPLAILGRHGRQQLVLPARRGLG